MPDSTGGAGFPNNINIGHEHLNIINGLIYQYLGDRPGELVNWKPIGGATNDDPNTTGWSERHAGAMWFNKSSRVYKFWDGSAIQLL